MQDHMIFFYLDSNIVQIPSVRPARIPAPQFVMIRFALTGRKFQYAANYLGLFGEIEGTVKNITFQDPVLKLTTSQSKADPGK